MQRDCVRVGTSRKCGWKENTSCLNGARHGRSDNGGWDDLEDRGKLDAEGFSLCYAFVGQRRVREIVSAIYANCFKSMCNSIIEMEVNALTCVEPLHDGLYRWSSSVRADYWQAPFLRLA